MSRTKNFLAWVMEDVNSITAEIGSPRDLELQEFVRQGYLIKTDKFLHDHNYAITSKWMQNDL